jgi:benzoyl-CoA reductase/2-hydroxyglutaryl-CoA dehydratase subunit BcrC/BadD/HgdB
MIGRELAREISDELHARAKQRVERGEVARIGIDEIREAIAAHPRQDLIDQFWGDLELAVCREVVERVGR